MHDIKGIGLSRSTEISFLDMMYSEEVCIAKLHAYMAALSWKTRLPIFDEFKIPPSILYEICHIRGIVPMPASAAIDTS